MQLSLVCAGSVQVEAGSLSGWGGRVSPGRQQQPMLFYLGDEFVPSCALGMGKGAHALRRECIRWEGIKPCIPG